MLLYKKKEGTGSAQAAKKICKGLKTYFSVVLKLSLKQKTIKNKGVKLSKIKIVILLFNKARISQRRQRLIKTFTSVVRFTVITIPYSSFS